MINRTKIKYTLKKFLPRRLFEVCIVSWKDYLLPLANTLDAMRLKKFSRKETVKLRHQSHVFSLVIDPSNGVIDKHIFLYGSYEPHILSVLEKYLKEGDTFFDIGANIGQHGLFAATIIGARGSVHFFEPIKKLADQIQESIKENNFTSFAHVHNYALGNKDETREFFIHENNLGGSSLVNDNGKQKKIKVVVKSGRSLESVSPVSMIKMDVKGYEYEVFSSIKTILAREKPIIIFEFSLIFTKPIQRGMERKSSHSFKTSSLTLSLI
jgi:FkbM family methyltransferase